ncbi:hypothetical protein BpHYR1_009099 [Brachionus plicatilis]|uniref:Uncharacterized protein n=1 Tax=Brachionus plicatilis TaxID=10195 RepID=A0A3M7SVL0_BRAPC|nr:hypothetical protein BpHYR1_009099 [Brachionus plicatilis]
MKEKYSYFYKNCSNKTCHQLFGNNSQTFYNPDKMLDLMRRKNITKKLIQIILFKINNLLIRNKLNQMFIFDFLAFI